MELDLDKYDPKYSVNVANLIAAAFADSRGDNPSLGVCMRVLGFTSSNLELWLGDGRVLTELVKAMQSAHPEIAEAVSDEKAVIIFNARRAMQYANRLFPE